MYEVVLDRCKCDVVSPVSGIKGLIAPVIGDLEPSSMPRRVVKAKKLGVETFLMKHSVGTGRESRDRRTKME